MKRRWAVPAALLLLLLLWLLRGQAGGPPAPGSRPGAVPTVVPPAPVPAKAAPPTPATVEVSHDDTKEEDGAPKPPNLEGGVGTFGRVVHADRTPAADLPVTVSLEGKVLAEVKTDAEGNYYFPPIDFPAGDRTHFEFAYSVRDGKGKAARDTLRMGVIFDPNEERTARLGGCGMQTVVLRDAATLAVRVVAGGAIVEGATVFAEEETPCFPTTGPVLSDRDGVARIEAVPHGRWSVYARAPGRGAGRARVEVPAAGPVEVVLSPRILEVEAVDAATGAPVEGIRFHVSVRKPLGDETTWDVTFPPPGHLPTDSAGRTRFEGIGDAEVLLRPIPRGREEPIEGTTAVEVDGRATTVRVPVPAFRTVSWPVEAGERGVPADGAAIAVGEERMLVHPDWGKDGDARWPAAMKGGALVVSGIDPGEFRALVRAPDGSLARIRVAADADRGSPIRFLAPRRLVVRVKDEDGKAVREPVALLDPEGDALAQPGMADEKGETVFEELFAGTAVVCALARTEWGGAEVARVDLAAGDRTVEVVVGRPFTAVARFRIAGKARLPETYELRWLTPGPAAHGQPHEEMADQAGEDAALGTLKLHVRPWAPGKPVTLRIDLPGRKPLTREIHPPAAGGEVSLDIDLE